LLYIGDGDKDAISAILPIYKALSKGYQRIIDVLSEIVADRFFIMHVNPITLMPSNIKVQTEKRGYST